MNGERIESVEQLETLLSEPTDRLVDVLRGLPGDILVLGAAGKMGPTLARMARRAADATGGARRVIAVSRFTSTDRARFTGHGVETIACDLLDEQAVARLPDAPNVVYMAGTKFGTTGSEALTWALNCYLPAVVCRRYPQSRIVAFSTGNVYGFSPPGRGGSREDEPPAPVGEYAMSCLGRERLFEHFSIRQGTPVVIVRLNYATELRYGVLVDIALKVRDGVPVDVAMGYLNAVWQGDANAAALCALAHTAAPPFVINVAGEVLAVRHVATRFGELLGRAVVIAGHEGPDALLSDASRAWELFGAPRVPAARLIEWIAAWVQRDGPTLGRPTHFEARDGRF